MELKFLEGKLAQCPLCNSSFLVRGKDIKGTDGTIACPQCSNGEYELTVEGRTKIIQELAQESMEKAFQIKVKELKCREQQLLTLSERLDIETKKVVLKSNNLDIVKEQFLAEYKEKYDKLLSRYHELKLTRSRLSTSLNNRRSEIREARLHLEDEKKAFKLKKETPPPEPEKVETEVGVVSNDSLGESINITLNKILEGKVT